MLGFYFANEKKTNEPEVTDPREVIERFLALRPEMRLDVKVSGFASRLASLNDKELAYLEELAQQLFGQPAFA